MKSFFGERNLKFKQAALVAYRAGSDLVGKAAFLLITIAAARRLSQEAFGIFSLASTVGWMTAIATDFGIQLHLARALAQRPGDSGTLLRSWLSLRVATSIAAVLITLAVVLSIPAARPYAAAMTLLTTMYVVSGLIEFLHYFYRGISRTDLESTLVLAQRLATLALALVVLWLEPDITVLAAVMVAPVAATFAYSLSLALSLAGPRRNATSAARALAHEWRRDVMPIGAGIVLSALYFRVDVFLVELWNGTEAVALYNAVFRLVEALRLFPAAVLAVALPVLCRTTTLKPLAQIATIVTAFGIVIAFLSLALGGWLVPFLYGAQYVAAVPAFRVLVLAFPLMSLNYALTHQLIGWNGHRAYAAICAAAFVFNVGLNALLLPSLSIVGAAWSTVWTELLLSAGCLAVLWLRMARPAVESAVTAEAS